MSIVAEYEKRKQLQERLKKAGYVLYGNGLDEHKLNEFAGNSNEKEIVR